MSVIILLIVSIVSSTLGNVQMFKMQNEDAGLGIVVNPNETCIPRGSEYGCHKGYCWSRCKALGLGLYEWCYTTRAHTFSYHYIPCSHEGMESQCSPCWNCAGPCSIFRKDLTIDGDFNREPLNEPSISTSN